MANTKTGKVIRHAGKDTATVLVVTYKNHPVYKKRFIYSKKYLVHDPGNSAAIDDVVVIKQSRPLSRRKCWVLQSVAAKASAATAAARELAAGLGEEATTVAPKEAPVKAKAKATPQGEEGATVPAQPLKKSTKAKAKAAPKVPKVAKKKPAKERPEK